MQAKVKDIAQILENLFPLHLAEKWDNVGLQIGSCLNPVSRVLVALDIDNEVLQYGLEQKVDMIVTHHPLFFNGIKSINYDQSQGRLLKGIITAGINVYSAHTNLDAGDRGLNQILAERIGLNHIKLLDKRHTEVLYKLVVYVPVDHESSVRQAILEAGAGHIGMYKDCSFRIKGTGSFRPLEGSRPFIGQQGSLEELDEYRLETVVPQSRLEKVLQKMEQVHPYEEVAYDVYRLEKPCSVFSLGRMGKLSTEMTLQELCLQIKNCLGLGYVRVVGDLKKPVRKVGVVSGAGASFIEKAQQQGCDVLLTGDLKYHEAKDAINLGIAVIDAGHQGTEQIMSSYLCNILREEAQKKGKNIEVVAFINRECIVTI